MTVAALITFLQTQPPERLVVSVDDIYGLFDLDPRETRVIPIGNRYRETTGTPPDSVDALAF